jgi:hypothetical protein
MFWGSTKFVELFKIVGTCWFRFLLKSIEVIRFTLATESVKLVIKFSSTRSGNELIELVIVLRKGERDLSRDMYIINYGRTYRRAARIWMASGENSSAKWIRWPSGLVVDRGPLPGVSVPNKLLKDTGASSIESSLGYPVVTSTCSSLLMTINFVASEVGLKKKTVSLVAIFVKKKKTLI